MDTESNATTQLRVVNETTLEKILSALIRFNSTMDANEAARNNSRLDASLKFASVVGEVRRARDELANARSMTKTSELSYITITLVLTRLERILSENPQHDLHKPL